MHACSQVLQVVACRDHDSVSLGTLWGCIIPLRIYEFHRVFIFLRDAEFPRTWDKFPLTLGMCSHKFTGAWEKNNQAKVKDQFLA